MAYVIFEIIILPIAYLRIWINLFKNLQGVFKGLLYIIGYAIFGPFLVIIQLFRDCGCLLQLLCYYNGTRFGKADELAEEEYDDELKVMLYNEMRATIIILYKKL